MFSFEPSDEQQMLLDVIKRYAVNDLRPGAHDADEESHLPPELVEKGWEIGILQSSIPDELGGFGEHSAVTGVLAAEEMTWGDMAGTLAVMTPGLFALPITLVGSELQQEKYLPKICESEWIPYSAALIEPAYDFDPSGLKVNAVQEDGQYNLNGVKTCVPYAPDAPEILVYANYDGLSQGFLVKKDSDGLLVGDRQKFLGIDALPLYEVILNNVKVPVDKRLGGVNGHDFKLLQASMNVAMAAVGIGLARAALEYAIDYAKDREVFGVKVAQKQVIAFMIAEMATEIESIRLLNWEAAWMLDKQKEGAYKHSYLALTGAADMVMKVTDRAVQILGGHGYIREHPVELWMRNGRGIAMLNGLAIV